jgi:DNA-binding NarL/FixJ family response regulator
MSNDQKVIVGFLCGVAAGALAGLLLAPTSGEETRKKITDKASDLKDDLSNQLNTTFGRLSEQKRTDLSVFRQLTEREIEILTEIGHGRRNRDIAETLFISEKTVKNHISSIFAKLEINSRAEAALLAARQGLV